MRFKFIEPSREKTPLNIGKLLQLKRVSWLMNLALEIQRALSDVNTEYNQLRNKPDKQKHIPTTRENFREFVITKSAILNAKLNFFTTYITSFVLISWKFLRKYQIRNNICTFTVIIFALHFHSYIYIYIKHLYKIYFKQIYYHKK